VGYLRVTDVRGKVASSRVRNRAHRDHRRSRVGSWRARCATRRRAIGRSAGRWRSIYGGDFDTWINREIFLAVQIESAQAVAHVDEIRAVEGVDGCWIGPNDLARSLVSPRICRRTPKPFSA